MDANFDYETFINSLQSLKNKQEIQKLILNNKNNLNEFKNKNDTVRLHFGNNELSELLKDYLNG